MTDYDRRRQRYEKEFKPAYEALMKFYPLTLENLDNEQWKPIKGYEELYHESNYGRTKRFYQNGNVKIIKPALTKDGYLRVHLDKNGKRGYFRVHQLVTIVFIPNPDNKPQVNHIDGCKLNNYVGNLEWATGSENMQHALATGLVPQGEKNYLAKFTNEQVLYIRQNPDGLTTTKLAEKFGVGDTTISFIQLGKHYKDAGGSVREKKQGGSPRTPDDIRAQILTRYQKGVRGCGAHVLAKEFGYSKRTILDIVHSAE